MDAGGGCRGGVKSFFMGKAREEGESDEAEEMSEEDLTDVFGMMYDVAPSEIFSNSRLAGCPI